MKNTFFKSQRYFKRTNFENDAVNSSLWETGCWSNQTVRQRHMSTLTEDCRYFSPCKFSLKGDTM